MPKLDIGKYYWYISEQEYEELERRCNSSETYDINMFGFGLHVAENAYDSSYVGWYAEIEEIDEGELEWIESLGLSSFDARL